MSPSAHHGIFSAAPPARRSACDRTRAKAPARSPDAGCRRPTRSCTGSPERRASWRGRPARGVLGRRYASRGSHRSAAALWDLPGSVEQAVAEITCPRWRRAQHDGLIVHESTALSERDITFVDGIPVTTVERTIFDLARCAAGDGRSRDRQRAHGAELTTFDELAAMLRRVGRRGRKGTRLLRASARRARSPSTRRPRANGSSMLLARDPSSTAYRA